MASTKTITQLRQLQKNTPPEVAVSVSVEAVVTDGVLTPGHRNINPGVFGAGTAAEGTSVNNHQ